MTHQSHAINYQDDSGAITTSLLDDLVNLVCGRLLAERQPCSPGQQRSLRTHLSGLLDSLSASSVLPPETLKLVNALGFEEALDSLVDDEKRQMFYFEVGEFHGSNPNHPMATHAVVVAANARSMAEDRAIALAEEYIPVVGGVRFSFTAQKEVERSVWLALA